MIPRAIACSSSPNHDLGAVNQVEVLVPAVSLSYMLGELIELRIRG
jgi:hypothetical protein